MSFFFFFSLFKIERDFEERRSMVFGRIWIDFEFFKGIERDDFI